MTRRCPILAVLLAASAFARPVLASPRWELRRGERCFRVNGRATFVLGRNPTETSVEAFDRGFRDAAAAGEKIVRVHLMHGIPPGGAPGRVDEAWAAQWDRVLDAAERRGIAVIPVFTIWAQWNDGSNGEYWHVWNDNPYNAARGGPAATPADLFRDTACRRAWLGWLGALVRRWQPHPCIVAWEPISEIDLVTGSTPSSAAGFAAEAARVVRAVDPRRRPLTVSLSGIVDWPEVNGSPAVDIVQTHPYGEHPRYAGNLDTMIVDSVRERLRRYGKPVLIGECGLDARPPAKTVTLAGRAVVGIRHALWASVVSGAMNGRMLWWEDGYDKYEHADIAGRYVDAAAPMARFVEGLSFRDLRPADAVPSPGLTGAALAGGGLVVGWFRDTRCGPPEWPVRRVEGEFVTLPGARGGRWSVRFTDARTGGPLGDPVTVDARGALRVALPEFEGSIAFIAKARSERGP